MRAFQSCLQLAKREMGPWRPLSLRKRLKRATHSVCTRSASFQRWGTPRYRARRLPSAQYAPMPQLGRWEDRVGGDGVELVGGVCQGVWLSSLPPVSRTVPPSWRCWRAGVNAPHGSARAHARLPARKRTRTRTLARTCAPLVVLHKLNAVHDHVLRAARCRFKSRFACCVLLSNVAGCIFHVTCCALHGVNGRGCSACALGVDRSLLREPCFMRADAMQHSLGCMRPSAMP